MTAPHQMMAWPGEEPKTERTTPTPRRLVPLRAVQWSSAVSSQNWRPPTGLCPHIYFNRQGLHFLAFPRLVRRTLARASRLTFRLPPPCSSVTDFDVIVLNRASRPDRREHMESQLLQAEWPPGGRGSNSTTSAEGGMYGRVHGVLRPPTYDHLDMPPQVHLVRKIVSQDSFCHSPLKHIQMTIWCCWGVPRSCNPKHGCK